MSEESTARTTGRAARLLVAVKRVRGMRLVGLVQQQRPLPKAAPAVVAQRRRQRQPEEVA